MIDFVYIIIVIINLYLLKYEYTFSENFNNSFIVKKYYWWFDYFFNNLICTTKADQKKHQCGRLLIIETQKLLAKMDKFYWKIFI